MKTCFDRFTKLRAVAAFLAAAAFLLFTSPAPAVIVATAGADVLPASPDVLMPIAPMMDELGDPAFGVPGPFPPGEAIAHMAVATAMVACVPTDGIGANALITITNLTPFTFADLHYVAAPGTAFSNFDGIINGASAFRIDAVGVNTPLVAGDVGADGLFMPGEAWSFVVDDYVGGGPPDSFATPGVVGAADFAPATASIVANLVPEPTSLGWLGLGVMALRRRRPRKS